MRSSVSSETEPTHTASTWTKNQNVTSTSQLPSSHFCPLRVTITPTFSKEGNF